MDRRQALQAGLTAVAGAMAGTALAADEGRALPGTAAMRVQSAPQVYPLDGPFEGWQGTMLEVTYAPGAVGAAHQHPGPTFGYVVSGRIKWAINGNPVRELGPGEMFFEPAGAVHTTSANASQSEPARLAVVIIGKVGEAITRPAPRPPGEA